MDFYEIAGIKIKNFPQENFLFMAEIKKKKSTFREYFDAFFFALIIAFVLRAFLVEAFKIPTKSMVPTLLVGDHIFVNKFTYGIRIPFTKEWITEFKIPEKGEVIVFVYPGSESQL